MKNPYLVIFSKFGQFLIRKVIHTYIKFIGEIILLFIGEIILLFSLMKEELLMKVGLIF